MGKSRHGGTQRRPKDKANREWAMKWREPQLYLETKELEVIKSLFSLPVPGFFNIDFPSHACFMEHRIFFKNWMVWGFHLNNCLPLFTVIRI